MEIVMRKVSELTPYGRNAKKHDDKQIANVANSIRRFGWQQPIVVDEKGVVVIGHCRLLAAKKLKLKEVPVTVASGLTEDEVKELRIADNKTNESPWDLEMLDTELSDLDFAGFDFDFETASVSGEENQAVEDDFQATLPEEPKAKIGDIYQLGRHRLMCGSATSVDEIDSLVGSANIDLVYTDPPYGMSAVSKSGVLSARYETDIMNDGDNSVAMDSFRLASVRFQQAKQVWWGANYYTECLPSAECWIVWDKNNGASDQTDCELAWTNFRSVVRQFTMVSEKKNRVHPTQKPCKLFSDIIGKFDKVEAFSSVLDLFGGSGSTLIACEQMGKTCYIMELDPHYVDVIIDRWEQFTGQKAVLLNGR